MFGLKSMYYSILLLLVVAIPSTAHRFGRVEEAGLSGAPSPPSDFNEKFEKIVTNVETLESKVDANEAKIARVMQQLNATVSTVDLKLETMQMEIDSQHHLTVAQLCEKLRQQYLYLDDSDRSKMLKSLADLQKFPKCPYKDMEACDKTVKFIELAMEDPCSGSGCEDPVGSAKGSCKSQKSRFIQWAQAVCTQIHVGEPRKKVLDCILAGIALLFAKDTDVRAREWAVGPLGKRNIVLWTVSENQRKTLLQQIPEGFLLSETLLGALAELPDVENLLNCTWNVQKGMWGSNSAGLVEEMQGGRQAFFVSGKDLLGDFQRPIGQTVAFGLELPQLGQGHENVFQLTVVNLHQETKVEHLSTAVRATLGVSEENLPLKQVDCSHCALKSERNPNLCMRQCLRGGHAFKSKDFNRVCKSEQILANLIGLYPKLLGFFEQSKAIPMDSSSKQLVSPFFFHQLVRFAAWSGNDEAVMVLVKVKKLGGGNVHFDINQEDHNGNTLLTLAVGEARGKAVRALVRAGARVEEKKDGKTMLEVQVCRNDIMKVKALLEGGASVNTKNGTGWSPLHFAAWADYDSVAAVLLGLPPANEPVREIADVNAVEDKGRTPLHFAASLGHEAVTNVLLLAHAKVNTRDEDQGWTPLQNAAAAGHVKVVRLLLNAKAVVNLKPMDSRWQLFSNPVQAPLYLAILGGHNQVANELIAAGADVNSRDSTNLTPLHKAAELGNIEMVKQLVAAGAKVNAENDRKATPLHLAAWTGQPQVIEYLVDHKAYIDAVTSSSNTPLSLAAKEGNLAALQVLLDCNATVNFKPSIFARTALSLALKNKHHKIAQVLAEHGAKP